jgi:peptide/nickel transport system substrate-binding protein
LALNLEHKPFDNVLVRRAVAQAIDLPAIVKALYAPGSVVAENFIPRGMLGDDPAVHAWPHDPAAAKSLLAQAGFPHGFSTTLLFPTSPRPYMPEPQRLAEAIQADLKQAGINVVLQPLELAVFLSKVHNGEHDLCLIGWTGDNGDPDNFYYTLLDRDSAHKPDAQNYSFWRDPAFHRLMLDGQRTLDEAARAKIYRQAAVLVHDQVPLVPIVHTSVPVIVRKAFTGFIPSPTLDYHFETMHVAK